MPPAGLVDLPNELLVDIFEHPSFPTEALYFLALLSRRLHLIALTIFFSRNGMALETKSVTITIEGNRYLLPALQICLFISSMDRISCIFSHPSCATIIPLVMQLKRLRAFISRLSSVKEVTLNLDSSFHARSRCLATGLDSDLKVWASQYGALLSCIVQRGCNSLTVINGGQMTETYYLPQPEVFGVDLPGAVRRLFPGRNLKTLGFRRKFGSGYGTDYIGPSISLPPPTPLLTFLHIHSATLLVPPGLDWTLAALRCSSITSLSICMSRIAGDPRLWSTILPVIASAAPNLTMVSLTEVHSGSEPAAFDFVARLPRLTELDFRHTHAHFCTGATSSLKYLTKISAPPTVVEHLLSRSGSLRSIRNIDLIWMAVMVPGVKNLVHPMSSIHRRLATRRLSPRISLFIQGARIDSLAAYVVEHVPSSQNACFERVESIHITGLYNPVFDTQNAVGELIGLFPGVRRVSFTAETERLPDSYALHLASSVRVTDLLKAVEIEGKSYDLSNKDPY
ncbi:hypothetical protein B0H19DRAFT_1193472 [Mycena capillaripes]|nr:hypothetical protein B0H19DRAFT_1193472 [Mycena capillaripes]